jgi:hypothetical protein
MCKRLGTLALCIVLLFVAFPTKHVQALSRKEVIQNRSKSKAAKKKVNTGSMSKPRCTKTTDVHWICKSCSECQYNYQTGWTKSCSCKQDPKDMCSVQAGQTENVEKCTPSKEQKSANDKKFQQQINEALSKPTAKDKMQANMDAWTKDREALSAKMNNMANQPNGRGCMPTLAEIDEDWVRNYNNYVDAYNSMDYPGVGGDWSQAIRNAEIRMKEISERIRLAPTYCY